MIGISARHGSGRNTDKISARHKLDLGDVVLTLLFNNADLAFILNVKLDKTGDEFYRFDTA